MKKIIALLLAITSVCLCMSLTIGASQGAYASGYVFYYQHFSKDVDLNATGITKADNVDANFMMDIDPYTGYLSTHSIAAPDYQKFILPDILPYEVTTFSVEVRFCFTDPATYRQGGLVVGFGEGNTRTDCNLRYNLNNGQFDRFGNLSNASQWVMGEWVNMKVMIKDGIFYQATVQVDGHEAVTLTSTTNTPANPGKIFFMINRAGIDFEYIRVVAGIDYTAYSGEYANTSYSGNAAPAETTAADTTTAAPETTTTPVETTTVAVETTTAPVETTTEAVVTTATPETTVAQAETTAPAVTTEAPATTGGCGGSITAIVGIIAIAGIVVLKKKQY